MKKLFIGTKEDIQDEIEDWLEQKLYGEAEKYEIIIEVLK